MSFGEEPPSLPGFSELRGLGLDPDISVYRALDVRNDPPRTVAIKLLSLHDVRPIEVETQEQLMARIRELKCPGLLVPDELLFTGKRWIQVMPLARGGSMGNRMIEGKQIPVPAFFMIAIPILEALAALHSAELPHLNLKPSNILFDELNQPLLADWHTPLRAFRQPTPSRMNLTYWSPEQTGMIEKPLDHRSDLYSVGAIFFELLCGGPPFRDSDDLALLHKQVAAPPPPPRDLRPDLPPEIELILLTLLEKSPSNRYQSTEALLEDLRSIEGKGDHSAFVPNIHSRSTGFRASEALIGRASELSVIREAAREGSSVRVLLLAGPPGTGKSRLVSEYLDEFAAEEGLFATHKYERLVRASPFEGLLDVVRQLADSLDRLGEKRKEAWRNQVVKSLAGLETLLIKWRPALGTFFGEPTQQLDELPPAAAKQRLADALVAFFRAMGKIDHPLIIFLDDLQWADEGTLEVVAALADEAVLPDERLLVIGAFREHELTKHHQINRLPEQLPNAVRRLRLGPLSPQLTRAWLSASITLDPPDVEDLAQRLHRLTEGNPLMLKELLHSLVEQGVVARKGKRWTVDLERSHQLELSADSRELLLLRHEKLSPSSRMLLGQAAVIGTLEPDVLASSLTLEDPSALLSAIEEGRAYGLIHFIDGRLRFVHDRVEEGLVSTLGDDVRLAAHRAAANGLYGVAKPGDRNYYRLAGHILAGGEILTPYERAHILAEAGRCAFEALAFADAGRYLAGAELHVPEDAPELHLNILEQRGALACTGNLEARQTGIRLLREALELTRDPVRRSQILVQIMRAQFELGERTKAMSAGIEAWRALGMRYPRWGWLLKIQGYINFFRLLYSGMRPLPPEQNPEKRASLIQLGMTADALADLAYYENQASYLYIGTTSCLATRCLEDPRDRPTQSYAAFLFSIAGQYERARELTENVLSAEGLAPTVRFNLEALQVAFYPIALGELPQAVERCRKVLPRALEARYYYILVSGVLAQVTACTETGAADAMLEAIELGKEGVERGSVGTAKMALPAFEQEVNCLMKGGIHPRSFESWHLEICTQPSLASNQVDRNAAVTSGVKSLCALGYWSSVDLLADHFVASGIAINSATTITLPALYCPAIALGHMLLDTQKAYHSSALKKRFQHFSKMARKHNKKIVCAAPYEHMLRAVEAELSGRVAKARDELEKAYKRAHELGSLRTAAAARFQYADLLARSKDPKATRAGEEATSYCREIGWPGLAQAWEEKLRIKPVGSDAAARVADPAVRFSEGLVHRRVVAVVASLNRPTTQLELLNRILTTLLQSTGAERGQLAVPEESGFSVAAAQGMPRDRIIPEPLLRKVKETGTIISIGDVRTSEELASLLSLSGTRSLMVIPIRYADRLQAVVYLESRSFEGIFTEEKTQIAEALSSACAVALESTSLRAGLEAKVEELRRINDELTVASRLKDEFLANVSHELRTPLNAILGLTEAVLEGIYGSLTEKQEKHLEIVHTSGDHLLALINEILDLAKVQAGKLEIVVAPTSVASVCQVSVLLVQEQALKKEQEISVQIADDADYVMADERRLKQILVNLLSNATKFSPPGSALGLDVHRADEMIHFTIWDEGPGIPKADQELLFEPFRQLDAGLAREHEGAGLGLSLVKNLTELQGGQVHLESEVGQGSRFTITIPISPAGPDADSEVSDDEDEEIAWPDEDESDDDSFPGRRLPVRADDNILIENGRRILLVEDNLQNIQMMESNLIARGYCVCIARDGLAAIEAARSERPDLILMDIQLPKMDGLQATRAIRKDPEAGDVPIIALTALAMDADKQRCLQAGCNAYLSKPIGFKKLFETISSVWSEQAESR